MDIGRKFLRNIFDSAEKIYTIIHICMALKHMNLRVIIEHILSWALRLLFLAFL